MEFWKEVRRRVLTKELSKRAACEEYGLGWHTLQKILTHDESPGYRQSQSREKRKLAPFLPIIHQILRDDRQAPKKQRHTAKRIFQRLREEHDFRGGETVVKDAVRAWNQSHQEVFLPLSHPPGEAQVDFGEATIWLAGQEIKVALFVMTLPYSGAIFMQAFPRECTETFLEGHHQKVASCESQQSLDLPLLVGPSDQAEMLLKQIAALKLQEFASQLALPALEHFDHGDSRVVVADPLWHTGAAPRTVSG